MKLQYIPFLLFAISLHLNGQEYLEVDTSRFIEWEEGRPLVWSDFQVRRPKNNPKALFALTSVFHSVRGGVENGTPNFQVRVLYVKKDSWTTTTESQRLLDHEQLHFDLAELYGRKIRNDIAALGRREEDDLRVYKKRIKSLLAEFKAKSKEYDQETKHGRIKEKQIEWEAFVSHELARLSVYIK